MNTYLKTAVAIVLLIAITTACKPIQRPEETAVNPTAEIIPQIVIRAHDFAYDVPKEIPAGWVSFVLENHGGEPHHLQLARLNDGVTPEQLGAALQQGPLAAMPLVTFPGGPGLVDPHGRQEITAELTPGIYVLLCLIPSPDGVPHVAKGMIAFTEVVAGATSASAPSAVTGVVRLLDYSFALPEAITAGQQVWQVVNEGKEVHEINLIKLDEGKTMADVVAFFEKPEGAPPFTNAGGFQGIDPGQSGYVTLDLTPGDYIAIYHVPSPNHEGKAHDLLGMVLPFTVQ